MREGHNNNIMLFLGRKRIENRVITALEERYSSNYFETIVWMSSSVIINVVRAMRAPN